METFIALKELEENPCYQVQRQKALSGLTDDMIDVPLIDLVNDLNRLPFCFTLQSCYGHFVCNGRKDPHNLEPLPVDTNIAIVEYRIAYIAFCIEKSSGKRVFEDFKEITAIDPENVQFCCADWFWKRQVNSYILQVEPDRFKDKDTVILGYAEALSLQTIRDEFFLRLAKLLGKMRER